jgi:hypothetical protein
MYPQAIAERLRAGGYDVEAITERSELRNLNDDLLFEFAQQEQRAIVTENIRDFVPIAKCYGLRSKAHSGLIFVDPGKYPRGAPRTTGRLVRGLERFLSQPRSSRPTSLVHWL